MSYKSLTQYITEAFKRQKLTDLDEITYPDGTVVNMNDVEEKVRMSMMTIHSRFPYFSPAIKALTPIFTNEINTMATDGVRLFMNPRFTDKLDYTQCVFVLLHECMHNVLNHLAREKAAGHTDHERANIAADYEVNGILEQDGMVRAGTTKKLNGCIDPQYFGKAYEAIYNDMGSPSEKKPQEQQQPDQNQSGEGQGQSGNGGGQGNQQQRSKDWEAGWNQAIADYNSGKLKI